MLNFLYIENIKKSLNMHIIYDKGLVLEIFDCYMGNIIVYEQIDQFGEMGLAAHKLEIGHFRVYYFSGDDVEVDFDRTLSGFGSSIHSLNKLANTI